MNQAISSTHQELILHSDDLPADQHPAAVFFAGLSAGSHRTMRQALDTIAELVGAPDAAAVNWSRLRYQHVAAIRGRLAEEYALATVNKMLSALRGVARAAWRLGQISAEDWRHCNPVDRKR